MCVRQTILFAVDKNEVPDHINSVNSKQLFMSSLKNDKEIYETIYMRQTCLTVTVSATDVSAIETDVWDPISWLRTPTTRRKP